MFFSLIIDETPCISHPCLNGGTCIDTTAVHYHHLDANMVSPSEMYTNGYFCKCSSGYTGTHCEGSVPYYLTQREKYVEMSKEKNVEMSKEKYVEMSKEKNVGLFANHFECSL